MRVLGGVLEAGGAQRALYVKNYGTPVANDATAFTVPPGHGALFTKLCRELDDTAITAFQLPSTMLVTMVSEFDVLVGRIIAAMLRDRPEILNASEKTLTFAQLASFPDVEAARSHLIEKEVEAVLRDSHIEQFKWMEGRLKIPLTKGLRSWPKFVEITERRNLLVHTDGIVSSQYLENCKRHGAPTQGAKVGEKLGIDPSYFEGALAVLLEIGIKLSQVVWRKIRPHDHAAVERHLTETTYDLLATGNNEATVAILEFFVEELKKFIHPEHKMICTINLAQALKWTKKSERMVKVLKNIDESILDPKYRLGVQVLRDDFVKASATMKQIGANGSIPKESYRDWPLFQEFRKSEVFRAAFAAVFTQSYDEYEAEMTLVTKTLAAEANKLLVELAKKSVPDVASDENQRAERPST